MARKMITCSECHGSGKVKAPPKRQTRADRAAALGLQLDDIREAVDEFERELQDSYDNMPENFQDGAKGQRLDDAINEVGNASSEIDSAKSTLDCIEW